MEELTVRRVDDEEREAGVECYECERPAEFVEESFNKLEGVLFAVATRVYYCEAHRPR